MSEGANVKVPRSIMHAIRKDIEADLEIEGCLPEDLHGHVFIVAPVGNVTSGKKGCSTNVEPINKGGNSFMNGDGMVYRLDFVNGKVSWKQRMVKPLDYLVDERLHGRKEALQFYELLKFRNFGLNRFSFLFGLRNQLNTAFLPMKFDGDNIERLLVAYDVGRPYEIDMESLEVVTPVGKIAEWEALFGQLKQPFPLNLTTAHLVFDQKTEEIFTVNYRRSIANFLNLTVVGIWRWLNSLFVEVKNQQQRFNVLWIDAIKNLALTIEVTLRLFCQILLSNLNIWNNNFVDLIKWDGKGDLKKWRVVSPCRQPIKIRQSMHEMGLTENYVVLMDTSFAPGIEQLVTDYPERFPILRKLTRLIPFPDATLYIINRNELEDGKKEVVARKVKIKREIIHFTVDYKDCSGEKIRLHVAHNCAWDVGEWLRKEDCYNEEMKEVLGMHLGQTDISFMGGYAIDMSNKNPKIIESESEIKGHLICTWGPALYTYNNRQVLSSGTIEKIYWTSLGLWEELTVDFMYQQYKKYQYRTYEICEIEALAKQGKPSCLFRLDAQSVEVEDYYEFPKGYMGISPQFVPRRGGGDHPTDGYIVCVVFTPLSGNSEIWIFDAADLKKGPECKLYHENFNIGMSLHTAWLPKIGPRQASYNVSVEEDYQNSVEQLLSDVERLYSLNRDRKNCLQKEIKELFPEISF